MSVGSTDDELFNIEEKAKDNKEEDNEEKYKENNDERDDESSDNKLKDCEEEDSEEENNNETASDDTLCCTGDLCDQQQGYIVIGKGHQGAVCEGRMHGFLCSDGKVEAMVGMTCKKCDNNNVEENTDNQSENSDMVLVEETDGNGNKVVNGECNKIQYKKKPKNQIQNNNKNNKNKHRNQDAGKSQTGTGPTSIILTSPTYQSGQRGRGGKVDMDQQHVRSTKIRFEEPKPLKPIIKPIQPEPERKDQIHQFKIKFN